MAVAASTPWHRPIDLPKVGEDVGILYKADDLA